MPTGMNRVIAAAILCVGLSACTTIAMRWPPWGAETAPGDARQLAPADHATQLITGGPLTIVTTTQPAAAGQVPVTLLALRFVDGRALVFEEANHTPDDLRAQAAGGPLAQAMTLFDETATPTLYHARPHEGPARLCSPEGPAHLGLYRDAAGAVSIVGLKEGFSFETRDDGSVEPLPVSPAIVCVRLKFIAG